MAYYKLLCIFLASPKDFVIIFIHTSNNCSIILMIVQNISTVVQFIDNYNLYINSN